MWIPLIWSDLYGDIFITKQDFAKYLKEHWFLSVFLIILDRNVILFDEIFSKLPEHNFCIDRSPLLPTCMESYGDIFITMQDFAKYLI